MRWQQVALFIGIAALGALIGSVVIVGAGVLGAIIEASQEAY